MFVDIVELLMKFLDGFWMLVESGFVVVLFGVIYYVWCEGLWYIIVVYVFWLVFGVFVMGVLDDVRILGE